MAKGSAGKGEPGGMASVGGGNAAFEVSMIPEDYKRLSPEVIAKIKPLTDDPETSDTGQLAARRYLARYGNLIENSHRRTYRLPGAPLLRRQGQQGRKG